jgi:hypothetical protein
MAKSNREMVKSNRKMVKSNRESTEIRPGSNEIRSENPVFVFMIFFEFFTENENPPEKSTEIRFPAISENKKIANFVEFRAKLYSLVMVGLRKEGYKIKKELKKEV